jgi:hypothetical protein
VDTAIACVTYGVSANAHYGRLKNDIRPVIYIPYNQDFYPRMQQMVYALRTAGEPLAYVNTVREIVHQADALHCGRCDVTILFIVRHPGNQGLLTADPRIASGLFPE